MLNTTHFLAGRYLSDMQVAVDRPGVGLSTASPARTYLDWAADIAELANHLEWDQFAVVGYVYIRPSLLSFSLDLSIS
jgi:pimeloyl-ACP methyl ester carboxylesterase